MIETWMEHLEIKQYERAHFLYGGRYSHEMELNIDAETSQTSPGYDIEFVEVQGRDGDQAVDNERLLPFRYPIRVFLQPDVNDIHLASSKISQWLKSDIRYKPLMVSWDPEYVYSAIFFEQFDIENMLPKFGRIALNFKCHPVKYALSGQEKRTFQNGTAIFNPENRVAKPLIEISGSGDIKLKNNGQDWLILKGVDGSISIDSRNMSAFKGNSAAFDKVNANIKPVFPVLNTGSNEITWTGNLTKLEITPRWEAIV